MKHKIALLIFLCILTLFVTKAIAAGRGCVWSGCTVWSSNACSTRSTGGSGRPNRQESKRCKWFGKEEFCCDQDCKYQQCGRSCQSLNMTAYREKRDFGCHVTIPDWGTLQGITQFCCPKN